MKQKKGFSLIELLIVIGIIAVLGGVMLTQFSGSTDSALAASCMNNKRTLCNAVLADATKEGDYPSAGAFQYMYVENGTVKKSWSQGWIGYFGANASCRAVSCYHDANDQGEEQYHSITNGTLWKRMSGKISAYVCPAHAKQSKKGKYPIPSWSYVMNSYFGWERSLSASYDAAKRRYGHGYLNFNYKEKPRERHRPPEKVLLFAEIPFMNNGVQEPEWSTATDTKNDMVLQYDPESNENSKFNYSADGDPEAIGFNHKAGNDYSAHVAFADGHCEKIVMPRGVGEDDLIKLTTWLCTGQEYTFNGSRYEKVSE